MNQLLSFSGRKSSGKSEICKILEKYDYININFADSLKNLVGETLEMSLETINKLKEETNSSGYYLTFDDCDYISDSVGIQDYSITRIVLGNTRFTKIRDILQIVGTDLIRKFNSNWHIESLLNKIDLDSGHRYVVSDARFPNELEIIRKLGEDWFLMRPDPTIPVSNHASENSVTWNMFDYDSHYINNKSLSELQYDWDTYFTTGEKPINNYRPNPLDPLNPYSIEDFKLKM